MVFLYECICDGLWWTDPEARRNSDSRGKDILAGRPAQGLPLEQKSGIYGQKWGSLRSMRKRKFENNWLGQKKEKRKKKSFKLQK